MVMDGHMSINFSKSFEKFLASISDKDLHRSLNPRFMNQNQECDFMVA
jgi:hypothetical protein